LNAIRLNLSSFKTGIASREGGPVFFWPEMTENGGRTTAFCRPRVPELTQAHALSRRPALKDLISRSVYPERFHVNR
jgi:hypothetical protein